MDEEQGQVVVPLPESQRPDELRSVERPEEGEFADSLRVVDERFEYFQPALVVVVLPAFHECLQRQPDGICPFFLPQWAYVCLHGSFNRLVLQSGR